MIILICIHNKFVVVLSCHDIIFKTLVVESVTIVLIQNVFFITNSFYINISVWKSPCKVVTAGVMCTDNIY